MINDEINGFVNAYRESLDRQKDLTLQNAENERRLQFQNLMGAANKTGVMYSNFPERSKYQYDTNVYQPSVAKINQTYQTGLQKLRQNTVDLSNQLASINEAIADLNETNNGAQKTTIGNYVVDDMTDEDYAELNLSKAALNADGNGISFTNASGSPIRFGTYASRLGANDNDSYLSLAKYVLPESEYNKLATAWATAQDSGYKNIGLNTGKNYQYIDYDNVLNSDYVNMLNALGLQFTK